MYIEIKERRLYPIAIFLVSLFGSFVSPVYAALKPREQEFVVTAYYSPLPGQCCYYRGNYEEEILFNGKGTNGADGTAVYPGMIAAPPSYSFGTVIELPSIGVVGTVHDLGSRIIEWDENFHRIDLWMGEGEEGLARALAWGVRREKGKVYPLGSENTPEERMVLKEFSSDSRFLASLPSDEPFSVLRGITENDEGYPVRTLQSTLKELGYLEDNATGHFGPKTRDALQKFQKDYRLSGESSLVTPETAAVLIAATSIRENNLPLLEVGLETGSEGDAVQQAQKLLRYLGSYRGRTDGIFDRDFKNTVTNFQLQAGVIQNPTEAGAGRIGPTTKKAILKAWKVKIVATKSKALLAKNTVSELSQEDIPKKLLSTGSTGPEVKKLQAFLMGQGYLPQKDITGTFGDRTKKALLQYQIDRKIVASADEKGAGVFGPATKIQLSKEMVEVKWKLVRERGIQSL